MNEASSKSAGEGPRTARVQDWPSRAMRQRRIFAIGEVLNATYQIVREIGSGGMGQVFEATDSSLDRQVAIKAMFPDLGPSTIRREAKVLAAVRHPGAVTVHAVGNHRGVEYMAMERIYGVSLYEHAWARHRRGGRFTLDEALQILVGIADGLAAVHRARIAHGDLKPSNVMLAPAQRVVLMDFGLARAECDGPICTVDGTVQYLAPEVLSATPRDGKAYLADVYAFGVVAYELLTGHLPFEGQDPQVIMMHVAGAVPDVRDARPEVPDELAAIVSAALQKDPDARPSCMDALAAELRALRYRIPLTLSSSRSYLVVDDDPAILRTMRRLLVELDPSAQVRTAPDAEAGLALVRENTPTVILLDLDMPKMNGLEMCMWLCGTHLVEQCTIFAMSATAQPPDVELLQQLGVSAFVEKGPDLAERMEALLRGAQRRS